MKYRGLALHFVFLHYISLQTAIDSAFSGTLSLISVKLRIETTNKLLLNYLTSDKHCAKRHDVKSQVRLWTHEDLSSGTTSLPKAIIDTDRTIFPPHVKNYAPERIEATRERRTK